MKAIINGFRYDTEKATLIGEASHGAKNDFSSWDAGLYVTPRAKHYFLAGSGGPMTRWSHKCSDNTTTGGQGIQVLTKAEALAWAEQYLDAVQIEAGFAEDIQDA
jgi:hypothetical protein